MKLDLITLPSHMSHALQPLNNTCIKPFKTEFKSYKHWVTKGKVSRKRIWHNGCLWFSKKHWINQTFARASKPLDLGCWPRCDGKKDVTQQVVHGARTKCSNSRFLGWKNVGQEYPSH